MRERGTATLSEFKYALSLLLNFLSLDSLSTAIVVRIEEEEREGVRTTERRLVNAVRRREKTRCNPEYEGLVIFFRVNYTDLP